MLGKLLKYDLKWVCKLLVVFYVLAIVFAIMGRGFSEIENSFIFYIIGQVCNGVAIAMIFNIIANNLMRTWARFIRNSYKDESYLTHTLPVKKQTIFLSKALTAIITMFSSALVILLCVVICYYSKENIEFLKQTLELVASTYDSTVIKFILTIFVVLILELLFAVFAGFLGIVLGHKSNNNKIAKSILYGFGLFMIPSVITLIVIFIMGLFIPEVMQLFNQIVGFNPMAIKYVLYAGIILYIIYITVYYMIASKQFKKGVNIE